MSAELAALAVREFQSLKSVDIPIGRFTAIVGPSNVGKSAIIRALRMLVRNGPATGLVRQGSSKFTVAAKFNDGTGAVITRGAKESKLVLIPEPGGAKLDFAKLGVTIPAQSDDLWRCPESELGDLTFSTQHDAPFMLGIPASAVAKQLGDLTNASLLMDAVREANRRRAAAAQDAVIAKRELDALTEVLKASVGLKEEKARLDAAEARIKDRQDILQRITALQGALQTHQRAQTLKAAAVKARALADRFAQVVGDVQHLHGRISTLTGLIDQHATLTVKTDKNRILAKDHQVEAQQLRKQADGVLKIAGVCPVCGSSTK